MVSAFWNLWGLLKTTVMHFELSFYLTERLGYILSSAHMHKLHMHSKWLQKLSILRQYNPIRGEAVECALTTVILLNVLLKYQWNSEKKCRVRVLNTDMVIKRHILSQGKSVDVGMSQCLLEDSSSMLSLTLKLPGLYGMIWENCEGSMLNLNGKEHFLSRGPISL